MIRKFLITALIFLAPGGALAFRQVDLAKVFPAGRPLAVAVDGSGRIFASQEGGTVTVTDMEGNLLMTLGGKPAKGDPVLVKPRGIAFVGDRILVTDKGLNRIAIFAGDGSYQGSIGREGDELKEFDEPSGIAVSGNLIFVADTDNDRIQVLGPNGVFMRIIGREGKDDALLREPLDLTVDPLGRLYVIDGKAAAVKIYSQNGEFLGKLANAKEPTAIASDNEGFFLAEQKTFKVCKYDFNGAQLFCFGSRGKDQSQLLSLDGLAADGQGRLFVADRRKGTIQIMAAAQADQPPQGRRVPPETAVVWNGDSSGVALSKLIWDGKQRLYGIDRKARSVVVLHDGIVEKTIKIHKWEPVALAIGPEGYLWVLDAHQERVLKLDATGNVMLGFGSSGSKEGYFDEPADLAISAKGLIYVADRDNQRIQVFNTGGTFLQLFGNQTVKGLFDSPGALALDPRENLLVLDEEKCTVSIFNPAGERIGAFGSEGDKPGQMRKPVALAVSPNEIYVLDAKTQTVKVFDHAGSYLREFGSPGRGDGEFREASGLAVRSDTELLVADPGAARIQSFGFLYTPPAPNPPEGLAGMRKASLHWSSSRESYVDGYRLYRSLARDGDYQQIAELNDTSYIDEAVEPEVPYYYRLTANARGGNEGTWGEAVQVVPAKTATAMPAGLSASAQEWSVDLTWQANNEPFLAHYQVYREVEGKQVLLGSTETPAYYEGNLEPDTSYTYLVSAVSIDGVESDKVAYKINTLVATRPPLEIDVMQMEDIFSNTYKIYETEGVGRIRITNNTRDQISKIKLAFAIKEFMDYPSEFEISNLGPRAQQEFTIKGVFNNQILSVTEDTAVQTEITASYYKNQHLQTYSKTHTIKLFEKHRMMWDERGRFSAFVTPKDPVILEFTRAVVTQYSDYSDTLLYAGIMFDTLGVLGVGYLQDPSNPFQITSGKTDFVDFLQYPRETLSRKSGDCDDLVGLYASILESIGIRTQVVEVPGHMFMMFATDLESGTALDSLASLYVDYEGVLWVPVEVTLVGSPFIKAWEAGSKNYQQWQDKGLTLLDIRSAWEKYKPASLPPFDWRPPVVSTKDIETKFRDELPTLRKIRVRNLGRHFLAKLKTNPKDGQALQQLGIVNAKAGEVEEALKIFEKAQKLLPGDAAVLNNLGNAYLLTDNITEAAKAYDQAAALDPTDSNLLVNLARCLLRLDMKKEASQIFQQALALDPDIANRYRSLSLTLGTLY